MSNLPSIQNVNDNFFGETIDQSTFKPPRIVLGQASSTGKEKGKFNMPDGSCVDTLSKVILIASSQSRVLYRGKRQSALCASDNFWVPSKRISQPLHNDCRQCPYQAWDNENIKHELARKNNLSITNFQRPLCKASYDLIMADEHRNPFVISFQGTQRK